MTAAARAMSIAAMPTTTPGVAVTAVDCDAVTTSDEVVVAATAVSEGRVSGGVGVGVAARVVVAGDGPNVYDCRADTSGRWCVDHHDVRVGAAGNTARPARLHFGVAGVGAAGATTVTSNAQSRSADPVVSGRAERQERSAKSPTHTGAPSGANASDPRDLGPSAS